jgi:hypothetical protein
MGERSNCENTLRWYEEKLFFSPPQQADISLHNKIWLHLLGTLQTDYYEL